MENRSLRITLACFVGAFCGTWLTRYYSHHGQWAPLGLLAGALIGRIALEPIVIAKQVKRAFCLTVPAVVGYYWQRTAGFYHRLVAASVGVLLWLGWLFLFPTNVGTTEKPLFRPVWADGVSCLFVTSLIVGMLLLVTNMGTDYERYDRNYCRQWGQPTDHLTAKAWWCLALLCAPPVVVCYWLPRGLPWVVRQTPVAVKATGRGLWAFVRWLLAFVTTAFRLIHSKEGVLVACDSLLGAAVGCSVNRSDILTAALIGGLAGAVLGFANYQLISVRWLKLVPVQSKS